MSPWKQEGRKWHEHYSQMFLDFYRDAKKRAVSPDVLVLFTRTIASNLGDDLRLLKSALHVSVLLS